MGLSSQIYFGYAKAKETDSNVDWKRESKKDVAAIVTDCMYAAKLIHKYQEDNSDIDYLGVPVDDLCVHMGQWMYEMGGFSSAQFIKEVSDYIANVLETV